MSTQEAVGRFVYSKFIQAGVQGLPDIKGTPALEMAAMMKGPRAESKLPSGYGRNFGEKLYRTLLKKFRNPELVEEAISNTVVKLVSGQMRVEEGVELPKAESFVITSAINAAMDLLRSRKRDKADQMPMDDEGVELDMVDPNSFQQIGDMLSPSEMRNMLREISLVHPKAEEWVTTVLEGGKKIDLAKQWGVSPNAITNWENRYMDKIQDVVKKYLKDAA